MPGLKTRLCHGPDGVNRPNDHAQSHLDTHPDALPISPQAMAVSAAWAMLKLCLCPILPLALSPFWIFWIHHMTLSPALSLGPSSAAPDWTPWTWFVPLLCLVLLTKPHYQPWLWPLHSALEEGCRGTVSVGAGMVCARVTSAPSLPARQGQTTLTAPNKTVLLVITVWSKVCLCQCQICTVVMP